MWALIMCAWHHRINPTKLMDGLFNYFLDGGWKGKIENTFWKKKLVPQLGIEPL